MIAAAKPNPDPPDGASNRHERRSGAPTTEQRSGNMESGQKWVRASALGLSIAIALGITLGVPAAMQYDAAPLSLANAKPLPADATQVAIEPASIHVIAVREHRASERWLSFASHRRAG
jgi:hypothetical protein